MIRMWPLPFPRVAVVVPWIGLIAGSTAYAVTPTIEWTRQFGTNQFDAGLGVVTNGPNSIYIIGDTDGSLAGPSFGSGDLFLANYNASGNQQWIKQLGTSKDEGVARLSLDNAGN